MSTTPAFPTPRVSRQQHQYLTGAQDDLKAAEALIAEQTKNGRRLTMTETAEVLSKVMNAQTFIRIALMVDGAE